MEGKTGLGRFSVGCRICRFRSVSCVIAIKMNKCGECMSGAGYRDSRKRAIGEYRVRQVPEYFFNFGELRVLKD